MFQRFPVLHSDILFSSIASEYFNMLYELTLLSHISCQH